MNEAERYTQELGKVLRTFDVGLFRGFITKHKRLYNQVAYDFTKDKPDWWFEGMMAKMVLSRYDMGLREEMRAKAILDALGWDYSIF